MNLLTRKFQTVDSIPFYSDKLREANVDVKQRIEQIEGMITTPRVWDLESPENELGSGSWYDDHVDEQQPLASGPSHDSSQEDHLSESSVTESKEDTRGFFGTSIKLISSATKVATKATKEVANVTTSATKGATNLAASGVMAGVSGVTNVATNLLHTNEGEYYSAGFVTFKTLGAKNAALQMVHYSKPFQIEVMEAPRPDDSK